MEVRLDLNESQQVMSVTLASQSGSMQLGVFAAPRAQGIWDEVREEISASVSEQGGSVKAAQSGPFGAELVGQLQVDGQLTPVRFIGVDGPRWFLRAMLVGAVAADRSLAKAFENVFRAVVVVRGPDPLPVRDQVPLSLPPEALPDGGGTVEDGQAGADRDPAGPDRPDAADRTAR